MLALDWQWLLAGNQIRYVEVWEGVQSAAKHMTYPLAAPPTSSRRRVDNCVHVGPSVDNSRPSATYVFLGSQSLNFSII